MEQQCGDFQPILNMKCEICKKELIYQKRFCSISCRAKGSSIYNKTKGIKPPSRLGVKCTFEHKEKIKVHFASFPNSMKNPETIQKAQLSKKKTYDLRGRKGILRDSIKRMPEYLNWRKAILERDSYTCRFCNKYSGAIHIDHIKPYSVIIREFNIKDVFDARDCAELWDIDNGRVLCVACHKKTDTYGNNKITNPKLYKETSTWA
jgi:5-methylcytosine-specific restriction endonuclease McrA